MPTLPPTIRGTVAPTFADALAAVRRERWHHQTFRTSPSADEVVKVPRVVIARLTETLCYAA